MTKSDFIKKFSYPAMLSQVYTGIPASISLAQAILETGSCNDELCKNANNLFGIKNTNDYPDKYCTKTKEFTNGSYQTVEACFESYKKPSESFIHHANIYSVKKAKDLSGNSKDIEVWANNLKNAGYATDPLYAGKLISIIKSNNLEMYDKKAKYIVVLNFLMFFLVGTMAGIIIALISGKRGFKSIFPLSILFGVIGLIFYGIYFNYKKSKYNKK